MEAHAEDLRSVTGDEKLVRDIKTDYHQADIDEPTMEMLKFVERVTKHAYEIKEEEIVKLRQLSFGDEAILNIVHIAGYFNHINRVADALGVDLEDFMIHG